MRHLLSLFIVPALALVGANACQPARKSEPHDNSLARQIARRGEPSPATAQSDRSAASEPAPVKATAPELSLLRRYGWDVEDGGSEDMLELPRPVTAYLSTKRYLEASKAIGLDFSKWEGHRLRVRIYKVTDDTRRGRAVRACLLLAGQEVVGAWLGAEDITPGIYPLDAKPHLLH